MRIDISKVVFWNRASIRIYFAERRSTIVEDALKLKDLTARRNLSRIFEFEWEIDLENTRNNIARKKETLSRMMDVS